MSLPSISFQDCLSFLMSWPLGGVRGQCQYPSSRWFVWCISPTLSPHTRHLPAWQREISSCIFRPTTVVIQTRSITSPLRHYTPPALPDCLWQLPGGEQNTSVYPQTHPLSKSTNQLLRWSRKEGEEEARRGWEEPSSAFAIFPPPYFLRFLLSRIFHALRNKEMSFFQLLFWSLFVLAWLSWCVLRYTAHFLHLQPFFSIELPSPFFSFPSRQLSRYE